jgi:hypothetical protein
VYCINTQNEFARNEGFGILIIMKKKGEGNLGVTISLSVMLSAGMCFFLAIKHDLGLTPLLWTLAIGIIALLCFLGEVFIFRGNEVLEPKDKSADRLSDADVERANKTFSGPNLVSEGSITGVDPIVERVREKFEKRSTVGLRKYGVGLDRSDLSRKEWFIHAQQELMDGALYLERCIQEEEGLELKKGAD